MTNQKKAASEWLQARDIIAQALWEFSSGVTVCKFQKTHAKQAATILARLANAGILTIRAEDYPSAGAESKSPDESARDAGPVSKLDRTGGSIPPTGADTPTLETISRRAADAWRTWADSEGVFNNEYDAMAFAFGSLEDFFYPESRDDKEQACMEAMNKTGSIRENLAALRAAAGEYDPSILVGEFEAVVAAERKGR